MHHRENPWRGSLPDALLHKPFYRSVPCPFRCPPVGVSERVSSDGRSRTIAAWLEMCCFNVALTVAIKVKQQSYFLSG